MTNQTKKAVAKVYWRVGIQDAKNWRHWNQSGRFDSFEAIMDIMTPWIKANPGRIVRFFTEVVYE